MTDFHAKMPMGVTGENLAEKYNITRQDCDEFALLSQKRWGEGNGKLISNIYYTTSSASGQDEPNLAL